MKKYITKNFVIVQLLKDIFLQIPTRMVRLWRHFYKLLLPKSEWFWWEKYGNFKKPTRILLWIVECLIMITELVGVAELYQIFSEVLKKEIRPLTTAERELCQIIFATSLQLDRVRLDQKARIGSKKYGLAYVSFWQINSWGSMHDAWFIHEMTHIWQYQQMGAIYIPKALFAQWFIKNAYAFGGIDELKTRAFHTGIYSFNLEQQAEIAASICWFMQNYPEDYDNDTAYVLNEYKRMLKIEFT
ncbi:MAG: hypothetical protein KBA06_02570 [Saprospiraceae bacterium]|nr:hypothetical protein [Saprospiraceae bacterium]